jgi:hypothetical protein
VASRTSQDSGFRGGGSVANPFAIDHEKGSDKASGAVGTIFAAGLLHTSSILLRWSHADGQCVDAEWMAPTRTLERDNYGNVNHSENFLEERGKERTRTKNTNIFPIEFRICNKPGSGKRASGLVGRDLICHQ